MLFWCLFFFWCLRVLALFVLVSSDVAISSCMASLSLSIGALVEKRQDTSCALFVL